MGASNLQIASRMSRARSVCAAKLGAALSVALLVVAASAQSTSTVSGVVVDPDGVPLSGARVSIGPSHGDAWTNGRGEFVLSDVPAGKLELHVTADDFEAFEATVAADQRENVTLRFQTLRQSTATIEVVGTAEEAIREIPGSVFLVSKEELLRSRPLDANEVLRRVPGITLREDSGPAAMRLNVGIRGLNPDRSRRVLMLEDGLPISLAPYGEPEMYYSPPIDRMERVEVLKGSGQIAHGPQTVGGVINFITPDPPSKFHGHIDLEGGQRGIFNGHASLGGSSRDQKVGWLASYLHKQGDGWRGFFFDIDDFQTKFTLKPNDKNTFAIKGGVYDENSNSTYLGLTLPMFLADPNQNPVTADNLAVARQSGSVTHTGIISPSTVLRSSFFAYHTKRFWGRTDFDRSDRGRDYIGIFGDPSIDGGAVFLRNSAGNRNREFNVFGGQSDLSHEWDISGTRSKLDAGARYVYEDANDKRVNGEPFNARTGTVRDDEDRFGRAFSAYVQNRFYLGSRVILTPGVRIEDYSQERHILRTRVDGVPANVDRRQDNDITKLIPGLGLSVKATESITFFSGVHRGFAPPRTKIAITSNAENLQLDAELSWNYEAGVRFAGIRGFRGELAYFRMDFSNQIITAAESGGATTTLINGGETLNAGFESSWRLTFSDWFDTRDWIVYADFRQMRLVNAEFTRNEIFGGNRLPYAPKNTYTALFGARQRQGLGFQFDWTHIGDQFADNNQTVASSADGTVGLMPSYHIVNLLVDYRLRQERFEWAPYFALKNAFDELYIASRAPQGIQPGMFRQANFGLKFSF